MKIGTQLDLTLANKEGLMRDLKAGGRLYCSDHEAVEFRILRGGNKSKSRITTLVFRGADFSMFRNLLGRILCGTALEQIGVQDRGLIFKDNLIYTQELSNPMCSNSSKSGRKPQQMNNVHVTKLKHKKKVCKRWKQK